MVAIYALSYTTCLVKIPFILILSRFSASIWAIDHDNLINIMGFLTSVVGIPNIPDICGGYTEYSILNSLDNFQHGLECKYYISNNMQRSE